jgi:hypothetical protein
MAGDSAGDVPCERGGATLRETADAPERGNNCFAEAENLGLSGIPPREAAIRTVSSENARWAGSTGNFGPPRFGYDGEYQPHHHYNAMNYRYSPYHYLDPVASSTTSSSIPPHRAPHHFSLPREVPRRPHFTEDPTLKQHHPSHLQTSSLILKPAVSDESSRAVSTASSESRTSPVSSTCNSSPLDDSLGESGKPRSTPPNLVMLSTKCLEQLLEMELEHNPDEEGGNDVEVPQELPEPQVLENIPCALENDVMCGRGGETNHHSGNMRYRQLVKVCQPAYIAAKRRDKPKIAEKIVRAVRKLGGRFIKRDLANNWRDVGNRKAREKTSQALREGAPELRNGPLSDLDDPASPTESAPENPASLDDSGKHSYFGAHTGESHGRHSSPRSPPPPFHHLMYHMGASHSMPPHHHHLHQPLLHHHRAQPPPHHHGFQLQQRYHHSQVVPSAHSLSHYVYQNPAESVPPHPKRAKIEYGYHPSYSSAGVDPRGSPSTTFPDQDCHQRPAPFGVNLGYPTASPPPLPFHPHSLPFHNAGSRPPFGERLASTQGGLVSVEAGTPGIPDVKEGTADMTAPPGASSPSADVPGDPPAGADREPRQSDVAVCRAENDSPSTGSAPLLARARSGSTGAEQILQTAAIVSSLSQAPSAGSRGPRLKLLKRRLSQGEEGGCAAR